MIFVPGGECHPEISFPVLRFFSSQLIRI